jgi:FAD/FMN-containing dehydrogenase
MSFPRRTVAAALRDAVRGRVIEPTDEAYDSARRVWNGAVDRRPGLIVRCADAVDVLATVRLARERDLPVTIRGGAHGVTGSAVGDGTLVIDLSTMRQVTVDAAALTAQVQGGATWGVFDRVTAEHGLATTGGQISTTGVAGLVLGGGIGWLMREYGASVDNLVSVDLVTAEGKLVTVSAEEHPDLFFAVRGGGSNFGIATSLRLRLHAVQDVIGGTICWPASEAPGLLARYREVTAQAPDELTLMVYFLPRFASAAERPTTDRSIVAMAVCYTGTLESSERLLAPLRSYGSPFADSVRVMSYVELQGMFDMGAPFGLGARWRSNYLDDLSDASIETIVDHSTSMTSAYSQVLITAMGGLASRVRADDTAFGNRQARHVLEVLAKWDGPDCEPHAQWAKDFHAAIQAHATGGVYVNFLDDEGPERIRAAYPEPIFSRLVELKARYDPDNFFRANQNIPTRLPDDRGRGE